MSKQKKNKSIIDPTFAESFYTTSVPAEQSGINYNFKSSQDNMNKGYESFKVGDNAGQYINESHNINWATTCMYLLPCGLCSRTGLQCPKHTNTNSWFTTTTSFDTEYYSNYSKKDIK